MRRVTLLLAILFCIGTAAAQTTPVKAPKKPPQFMAALNPFRTVDVNSPKFIQATAQLAHVSFAYGTVQTFSRDGHGTFGAAAMGGIALSKEFIYDRRFERQSWKSNLRDVAFYGIGIGLAILQNRLQPIKR